MTGTEDSVEAVAVQGGASPEAGASHPEAWVSAVGVVAAGAFLSACGGGGTAPTAGPSGPGLSGVDVAAHTHTSATSDAEAARFLQQAQFSSTTAEINELRGMSYAQWLANQFVRYQGITGWNWL